MILQEKRSMEEVEALVGKKVEGEVPGDTWKATELLPAVIV